MLYTPEIRKTKTIGQEMRISFSELWVLFFCVFLFCGSGFKNPVRGEELESSNRKFPIGLFQLEVFTEEFPTGYFQLESSQLGISNWKLQSGNFQVIRSTQSLTELWEDVFGGGIKGCQTRKTTRPWRPKRGFTPMSGMCYIILFCVMIHYITV